MRFSRQEYWSGLPCPPPRDLPDPGIKPASLISPALAGRLFTTSHLGSPNQLYFNKINFKNNKEKELPRGTQGPGWSSSHTRAWLHCRSRHRRPKSVSLLSWSASRVPSTSVRLQQAFPPFLCFHQLCPFTILWREALFQCHKPTFLFGTRASFLF